MKIYILVVDDSLDSLNLLALLGLCKFSEPINNYQQEFILKSNMFGNLNNIIKECSPDLPKPQNRERKTFSLIKNKSFSLCSSSKNLKWLAQSHFKRA